MATNDEIVGTVMPNSHKFKAQQEALKNIAEGNPPNQPPQKKKVERVASASMRKPSLSKRFADAFVKEDLKSVAKWAFKEKLFPDLVQMFLDTFESAVRRHFGLGGGSRNNSYNNYTNISAYQYGNYYKNSSYNQSANKEPTKEERKGSSARCSDVIFETKADANEVLSSLQGFAQEYPSTSVGDFYDLSGLTPPTGYCANDYGWTFDMLKNAHIRPIGDGYILDLPTPIPINNN